MIPEDIIGFLRGIAPFSDCPSGALRRVAATAEVLFVPKGRQLPATPGDLDTHLFLIRKGQVQSPAHPESRDRHGKHHRPGTVLTPGAWLDDTPDEVRTAPCTALTDVLCILLERNAVADALAVAPGLLSLLTPRCSAALRDRAAAEMRRTTLLARHEADTWHHTTLATLTTRPAPCVAPGDAISEAARIMVESGASAVLVVAGGHPCGIVTVRDLAARVLARNGDGTQPVGGVMSSPVFTLPPETPALDALLAMTARGIHHVAVMPDILTHDEAPCEVQFPGARCETLEGDGSDREHGWRGSHFGHGFGSTRYGESPDTHPEDDAPPCLLSSDDLLSLRGTSPAALFAALREAKGLSDLVGVATRVDALAFDLLCEGAGPEALHTVTARLHDRLALRLIHMAEETLGPPPVPYAFMTFGPSAREEALLRPMQRTGIVFMPPPGDAFPETGMRAARYCRSVATFVTDGLAALGFARDPQGRMAPALTLPLTQWLTLCANGEARSEAGGETGDTGDGSSDVTPASIAQAGQRTSESSTSSSLASGPSGSAPDSPPLLTPRIPTADLCDARTLHGAESLTSAVRDAARHTIRLATPASVTPYKQTTGQHAPHILLEALVEAARLLAVRLGVDAVGTRTRLRLAEGLANPDTASVCPEARCALDVLLLITAHDAARTPSPADISDRVPALRSPLEALALRRAEAAVARFVSHVHGMDVAPLHVTHSDGAAP